MRLSALPRGTDERLVLARAGLLCVALNGTEPTYNWMNSMFCCHLKKVRKELPANGSIENA